MIPRQEISSLGKEGEPGLGNGVMMEGAGGVVEFDATGTFLPGEHRPTFPYSRMSSPRKGPQEVSSLSLNINSTTSFYESLHNLVSNEAPRIFDKASNLQRETPQKRPSTLDNNVCTCMYGTLQTPSMGPPKRLIIN